MKLLNNFFFIEDVDENNGLPIFLIKLVPSHEIFKAHLPGNPIMPGVCQIQILSELIESYIGKKLFLSEIKNVKFLYVLTPKNSLHFNVHIQKLIIEDNEVIASALLYFESINYAKISLTYKYSSI